MKVSATAKPAKVQCASCPFRHGGIELSPERMQQIKSYLLHGTNHFCHSDLSNETICRGGREFQLKHWHLIGWIAAPTEDALGEAMNGVGIKPKGHV